MISLALIAMTLQLAAQQPPPLEVLSPVPDRVLADLLDGVHLDTSPSGLMVADREEYFFADGIYLVQGRTELQGRYTVRRGGICTRITPNPETCFDVMTDGQGRLFKVSRAGPIAEIRFSPILSDQR